MICQKTAFRKKKLALKRLQEIEAVAGDRAKYPIRAYKCPRCGNWHLTSMTRATQKAFVKREEQKKVSYIHQLAAYWSQKKGWNLED